MFEKKMGGLQMLKA